MTFPDAVLLRNVFSSIVLPLALVVGLTGAIAVQSGLLTTRGNGGPVPATVSIPGGRLEYRESGEFFRNGLAVDAPMIKTLRQPLEIMKYQVSAESYDQCVFEGSCARRDLPTSSRADLPVTGVSFDDASTYAHWLSDKTGEIWRLPTTEELAFAAGSKYPDDALGIDPDSKNPALRWLADYERETARKASRLPHPQPYGSFGENDHGLADFGGNIWEWTSTCLRRVMLDRYLKPISDAESCGIYITAGKHIAPLSSFIREPKGGGCSAGAPPDNVGFRLVRDRRWYAPLLFAISGRPM
ncbi:formylglycine-generating enzyme family protein [Rhizobium wenxiniae]|uniref:formylglycine-generating enzyme family protein n=1 Tax=Rhizobium wenxiniae TaxID=1737357 RepID=UPI001C6DF6B3|nr:formylglycine-generating enzyme family protein [Rhizobium wenxiniae]